MVISNHSNTHNYCILPLVSYKSHCVTFSKWIIEHNVFRRGRNVGHPSIPLFSPYFPHGENAPYYIYIEVLVQGTPEKLVCTLYEFTIDLGHATYFMWLPLLTLFLIAVDYLTHWGRVMHICVTIGTNPLPEPMVQYCNWTFRNKPQWQFNLNWNIFIQENASKMSSGN